MIGSYPGELSYRQVLVGRFMIGLVGLDEIHNILLEEMR